MHYVGVAFSTGEEFDASWNRGQPFEFKLGKGQVIPGWDAGVQGMRVGGRRKLTIPSAMAYGARGAGGVIAAARAARVRGRSARGRLTRLRAVGRVRRPSPSTDDRRRTDDEEPFAPRRRLPAAPGRTARSEAVPVPP